MRLSDILDRGASKPAGIGAATSKWVPDPWGRDAAPAAAGKATRSSEAPISQTAQPQRASSRSGADAGAAPQVEIQPPGGLDPKVPAPAVAPGFVLPAPLRQLPASWGLEVQRIAHYLNLEQHDGPQTVVLAGLTPQSGVSTLSYLLAHHLAGSGARGRTLLIDFRATGGAASAEHFLLYVGQAFSWQQLPLTHALNCVSLRGGDAFSVSEKLRWFRSLLHTARQLYAHILIDVPPLSRSAEGHLLAGESSGVVLVLKSGEARKPALAAQVAELKRMDVPVLGAVITFRRFPIPGWLLRWL